MNSPETRSKTIFRLVAIDPGTNALGVAVLDFEASTGIITVQHAATMRIDKFSQRFPEIMERYGERVAKLYAVRKALGKFYLAWLPTAVVSEGPYMGQFAAAYAALVECISAIRTSVYEYDKTMMFPTIDPATVKKSVGVSGKSGDKAAVAIAIGKLTDLVFSPDVDRSVLDEHSCDAVAVGYAYFHQFKQG